MAKTITILVSVLVSIILILSTALGVFLGPLFRADEMLAQIRFENKIDDQCYLVSLEILPDNDEQQRDKIVDRQAICGDFFGLGYEFTLPQTTFAIMKKPGIVITNLVAIEKKNRDQTGNIQVGRYELEFVETFRELVATLLKKTPIIKSVTYDMKFLLEKPKEGAVISYKLEPFRQQVIAECEGCEK